MKTKKIQTTEKKNGEGKRISINIKQIEQKYKIKARP